MCNTFSESRRNTLWKYQYRSVWIHFFLAEWKDHFILKCWNSYGQVDLYSGDLIPKAWPTYEKSMLEYFSVCYRNWRNTSYLSQIFKLPQISYFHRQALPGLLSIQKYRHIYFFLPLNYSNDNNTTKYIIEKALLYFKTKSMIFRNHWKTHLQRWPWNSWTTLYIYFKNFHIYSHIIEEFIFKWHSNHANSPDVIICCWPKVLQMIF